MEEAPKLSRSEKERILSDQIQVATRVHGLDFDPKFNFDLGMLSLEKVEKTLEN